MLAGLAQVLPKNVWQYVVQIPRLAELGRVFVLQGGTQHNLAAVKAQVDYIKERVPDAKIVVHPHSGEAGAIGAAMETLRVVRRKRHDRRSSASIRRSTSRTRRRTTNRRRCHFCPNNCSAHVHRHRDPGRADEPLHQRVLVREGHRRERRKRCWSSPRPSARRRKQFPNLVDYEAKLAFEHFYEHAAAARRPASPIKTTRRSSGFRSGAWPARALKRGFLRVERGSAKRARSACRAC